MFDLPLTVATPLTGPSSLESAVESIPPDASIKGMFFRRFADILGADYQTLAGLDAPANAGKYVAFREYPERDYARIVHAASKKRFPSLPGREALRQIAREDFQVFAESVIGKVVLTVAGDTRSALLLVPNAYRAMAPAEKVRSQELDARRVQLVFEPFMGFIEYTLGQLEGVVLAFHGAPLTTISALPSGGRAFIVTHTR